MKDKISYIIIGAIIFTALLPILGAQDGLLILFQYLFILSLGVFYALVSEKKDLYFLTILLLVLQVLSLIGFSINISNEVYSVSYRIYSVVSIASYLVAALALWLEARNNKKSGNIEIMEMFLIIFLLMPLSIILLKIANINIPDFLSVLWYLGIASLIVIIITNKKKWLNYTENKKHVLILFLVGISVEIIKVFSKFIL